MKTLALIPARGGSKSIPRKNIKPFAGKPLIAWTIETAISAACFSDIVVSTDDAEIAQVSKSLGAAVPFLRPPELSTDEAPGIAAVIHAIEELPDYDCIMLLQPTSPLRCASDILQSLDLLTLKGTESVVSVTESDNHPYWMYTLDNNGNLRPFYSQTMQTSRRQDLPILHCLNGAIYLARTHWILERKTFIDTATKGYPMPRDRSIDIDTQLDWDFAEFVFQRRG